MTHNTHWINLFYNIGGQQPLVGTNQFQSIKELIKIAWSSIEYDECLQQEILFSASTSASHCTRP